MAGTLLIARLVVRRPLGRGPSLIVARPAEPELRSDG
jgi:hypothetical protein